MQALGERYLRFQKALDGAPLPAALVDLAAFDRNLARLLAPVVAAGKTLRVASKSVRVPALLRRALVAKGARGVMTYCAKETLALAEDGFEDLLLAYPTVQRSDQEALVAASKRTTVSVVCDAVEQLEALSSVAGVAGVEGRVIAEVDLGFRPVGDTVHLGVRRSPLRTATDIAAFADRVARTPHLRFCGVMGYEAHIAGLGDSFAGKQIVSAARRALKVRAQREVERTRGEIATVLRARGHAIETYNGGGSGSVDWTSREPWLTEVTAGSGLLDSHLFDHYQDIRFEPAAYFALQVVRRPKAGMVTCLGGGFVASGQAGVDRLPIPALPEGCALLPLEGAGEVQTPVVLPAGVEVALGEPIFFRHAKAGELAEHFAEYHLIDGARVELAPTYRGRGWCFLG